MTQETRILSVLKLGRNVTKAQLMKFAGAADQSVTNRISSLRAEGYAIYTNTLKNGQKAYRLGTPSREMVRVAHSVTGARLFQ